MGATAGSVWPSATPPRAGVGHTWEITDVAELPRLRATVRRLAASGPSRGDDVAADLRDQLVLALDEMASNALRHGGGSPVIASLRTTESAYLIEVSDGAASAPPVPAVGRDPSQGGLGLHLIAELATAHGWCVQGDRKVVWALLPRR